MVEGIQSLVLGFGVQCIGHGDGFVGGHQARWHFDGLARLADASDYGCHYDFLQCVGRTQGCDFDRFRSIHIGDDRERLGMCLFVRHGDDWGIDGPS